MFGRSIETAVVLLEELTVTQAAERLSVSENKVRQLCSNGALCARKVPMVSAPYERWAVDAAAVERYARLAPVDIDSLLGKRALATIDGGSVSVLVLGWLRRERNTVRVSRLQPDGRTVVPASEIVDVHALRQHPGGPEPDGGEFWHVCSTCSEAQPASDYYVVSDKRYAGGEKRVSECKTCYLEGKRGRDRVYHAANRKDIAQRKRAAQERKHTALRESGYIPAAEVYERLSVSRQVVSSLAKRGTIERHPSRRGWYDAESVERYLQSTTTR